jgi:flagellar biosynthesis/type III secretory pathway M-ring protein FliF/YscJ
MEAMDLIRRYLAQIRLQLAALTMSQKLLIAVLGVIMLGTIFWTVVYSAKPQMVPLIAQPMTPDEINRVEMAIKGKYQYQVSTDKVLVPVEQAYQIRGELASQQLLPRDLRGNFGVAISQMNMFNSEAANARIANNALEQELTRYLTSFPYVTDGSVIISLGQPQSLGRAPMPSTATVYVQTRNNAELSSSQVQAIAEMINGAVSGMKREDVHVIVNGQRVYHAPSGDMPMPADIVAQKKVWEDYLANKLLGQFSNFGDVKIAVNVVPDNAEHRISEIQVDPKNVIVKPTIETNHESSSQGVTPGSGEPGVKPNVVTAVTDNTPAAPGHGSGSTSSESHTENQVVVGSTTRNSIVPAGVELKELSASISLPRSYFVSLYHRQVPDADPKADPKDDEAKFVAIVDKQIKSARELAKNAIGAKSDDQVRVDWYDDTIAVKMPEFAAASATFASGTMPMISQYARQGVLALLALGALGMMLRMVRRAVPAGADDVDTGVFAVAGTAGKKGKRKGGGVEQLDAADDVFGEANQGEAVLTGIELDDETLASRKMVDEVSIMIKENPENAAALVKRWMTKSK